MEVNYNQFLAMLLGYNKKKTAYPEPWCSAPSTILDDSSRTIHPGEKSCGMLSYTVATVMKAIRNRTMTVARLRSVDLSTFEEGESVVLQYRMDPSDVTMTRSAVVAFNPRSWELSAAIVHQPCRLVGEESTIVPKGDAVVSDFYALDPSKASTSCNEALIAAIIFGLAEQFYASEDDADLLKIYTAEELALLKSLAGSVFTILEPADPVLSIEDEISDYNVRCAYGNLSTSLYNLMRKGETTSHLAENMLVPPGSETSYENERILRIIGANPPFKDVLDIDGRPHLGFIPDWHAAEPIALDGLLVPYSIDRFCGRMDDEFDLLMFAKDDGSEEIAEDEVSAKPAKAKKPRASKKSEKKSLIDELREECKLPLKHELNPHELDMVPRMGENYEVDNALAQTARNVKIDWEFLQDRVDLAPNYILEGDAGSGKTAGSKFLADVWGIPRTKITMHPLFEASDLIGAFYPVFLDVEDWALPEKDKAVLLKIRDLVEETPIAMGKDDVFPKASDVTSTMRRAFASDDVREAIRTAYNIPSDDEVAVDPDKAWKDLGHDSEAPDVNEVLIAANRAFESKAYKLLSVLIEQSNNGGVNYQFVMSELMKAFKNGWLVEIQEAASVLRPGVLTQLNSLLEPRGRIELPNGQFITRHPDTIVIITTNRDYAGNIDLNESLRDRCNIGMKMDNPTPEVMAARALAQVPLDNPELALEAAKVVSAVAEVAKIQGIKGAYGMRSLLGWMLDIRRGIFTEESFLQRVVWKMTTRDDDVEVLMATYRAQASWLSKAKSYKGRPAR